MKLVELTSWSRNLACACLCISMLSLVACNDQKPGSGSSDGHDHAEHAHSAIGKNGGQLIELGAHLGHLEVILDHGAAKLDIYVSDAEQNVADLEVAPILNWAGKDGPKALTAKPVGESKSRWVIEDEALRGEPTAARFKVVFKGDTYNPDLPHHH